MDAYLESTQQTLSRLGTDPELGLSAEEAQESRQRHGANSFTREKPKSLAKRIWESASEPMILMLIAAALITLG